MPTECVDIKLPDDLASLDPSSEQWRKGFADLLNADLNEVDGVRSLFIGALDLDLQDDREVLDMVQVDKVEVGGGTVTVHYSAEFSAYFGCDDMNTWREEHEMVEGEIRGCFVSFPVHESPPERYPSEEL